MTKQKRCLVFEAYPVFSGSQRISYNVCSLLREKGFHITLLTVDDKFGVHREKFSSVVDAIETLNLSDNLKTYGNADSWFGRKTFFNNVILGLIPFFIKCLFYLLKGNFDIIYFCDPRGATLLALPAWFVKGKKILHFHSKNRLPVKVSKFFLRITDLTICVSRGVYDSLPDSSKKVVIYNPVELSFYSAPKTIEDHSRFNFFTKFLYVGTLKPHKGLHHLLTAFANIKKEIPSSLIKLYIVGDSSNEHEENFKNEMLNFCINNSLKECVIWVGKSDNVLGWMSFVDYFVFPTIDKEKNDFPGFGEYIESTEGLPTVLVEASLSKLFSIASNVTGVHEVIEPELNGLIYDANKKDALENALKYVLINNPKYSSFKNEFLFSKNNFNTQVTKIFSYA